jgi:heat shock protein HtpX
MTLQTTETKSGANSGAVTHICPQCGAAIPVDPDFVDWCDRCGWNVQPLPPVKPANRIENLYLSLGDRMGKSLLDEFVRDESLRPKLTAGGVVAFIIACLTHGMTLALAAAGVWVVVTGFPFIFIMLFGAILVLIAVVIRPRFPKLSATTLSRESAPTLYRLTERISAALNAPKLDGIVISSDYNASFGIYGLRRKRVVRLGLPLLTALDGQELVALIAHELAHCVNGDPMRSYVVGTAVHTLFELYSVLWGMGLSRFDWSVVAIVFLPINLLFTGLAFIALGIGYVLVHLLWRDKQRAEYIADRLSAKVSGTRGVVSMLKKLPLVSVFSITLQHVALDKSRKLRLFDEFKQRLSAVPAREFDRIGRALRLDQSRLDATHPPTAQRLALLEAHPCPTAEVTCSQSEYDAIYRELDRQQHEIQAELTDSYLGHLYA